METRNRYIIAIGSNYETVRNIALAQDMLLKDFQNVKFTRFVETMPVGMPNELLFVNGLAELHSTLVPEELKQCLKQIEQQAGRTKQLQKEGFIPLDLDIIIHNDAIVHKDIERDYINLLLREISPLNP